MKKLLPLCLSLMLLAGFFSMSEKSFGQTVSTTIYYTGFQACGGCTVCGSDYWCFNTLGSYCGNTAACGTETFFDPVPPGNIVDNIQVNYYTADCAGGSLTATIDGNTVPAVNEGNSGCWCSNNPCAVSAATSSSYPCGMPNYVYGGTNTLQLCTGNSVCVNKIVLIITYVTPATINPVVTASGPTNFCQGGSVVLNAGSGYSAYTWNTGANTQTITVTTSGTYWVTVTSSTGCTTGTSTPVTVTVHPNPTPSIAASTTAFCSGSSAVLTASAGYSAYAWSTGQNTQSITVTATGTYNVTVTDANGCQGSASVTVSMYASPTVSATSTQAGCSVANGSATAFPSGGTGPYTYLWSNGDPNQTANNLSGGTYNVTVTDANGCTAQTSVTISSTAAPNVTASGTPAGCSVANGTATANPSGGVAPYTYLWSNGDPNQTATGLASGTYNVTVTDANGCTAVTSVSISGTSAPTLSTSVNTNVSCNGGSDGSATVNPTGGAPGYTYSWSNGQTTQTVTGLSAGTYNVIVTDANGCAAATSVSVSQPTAITTTTSSTNALCNSSNTGSATVNPSGGTPGYNYSWSTSPSQNTQTATGLSAGTYSVIVTDANGCTAVDVVNVLQPSTLSVSTTQTNILCNGGNNGNATANPTGGTPGYTYSWSNGDTNQMATGLVAGTYSVLTTDANGCTSVSSVTITQPSVLTATANSTAVSCNGGNDGTATAIPAGGTPGYTFVWNNGQTAQTATGLSYGTYTVSITDANGCTTVTTASVSQPTVLTSTTSQTTLPCYGGNNGTATATPSGGTPGYNYSWNTSPAQNTQTATGLSAGTYNVIITDANGCTTVSSVTLTQPSQLFAVSSQTNLLCYGDANGTATINPSGGTPGYNYSWSTSPVQNTQTATGLANGTYNVTVTDANGCTIVTSVTITQPLQLLVTASTTSVTCNGGTNGAITATASGGSPGYSYSWSSGQSTPTITGLSSGTYVVTITDVNGCTTQTSVNINQPTQLVLQATSLDSVCPNENATLTANASGGNPSYTYNWNNGQTTSSISVNPSSATSYTVSVTDASGCTSASQTVSIFVFPSPSAGFSSSGYGQYDNPYMFTDSSSGSSGWLWIFSDGTTSAQQNPVHTFPSPGTYTVTQLVTNKYGCTDTIVKTVIVKEGILIPNVFSPDGDGSNDVWFIPNSGMKEYHLEIFDRWGAKMFETTASEIRWDGRSVSGKLLNDGTYYFSLRAVLNDSSGKDYSTTGYVTILTQKK